MFEIILYIVMKINKVNLRFYVEKNKNKIDINIEV